MRRHHAPLSLAALLLLLVPLASLACRRAAERPPLVLLISVDTLRRDALRAFDPNAPPHPHLDAFAAESARLERAVAAASWTLPSHGSMLTGLYPPRHGATDPRVALASDVATLAERFRAGGFETIGITQGGYLDRRYGFGRGFDAYADAPPANATVADAERSVFDQAASAIAARKDARPLFLFLQTFSVHDYFRLQPWALAMLAAKPPRPAHEYAECLQGARLCDPADWSLLREIYAAEVRNLDAGFGRLRAALEAAGLWQTSVIVLTSDHGEGFAPELARIHHGGRLHEDLVRVPLLAHGPGIAAREVATPASLVDVAPTLRALAGLEPPADVDGRSLAALLRGGDDHAAARPLFAFEHYESWVLGARIRSETVASRPLSLAVIDGDRWYLRTGRREWLYDVAADPHQEHDLGAAGPEVAALRALGDAQDVGRTETALVESGPDLQERLRALGYAQ